MKLSSGPSRSPRYPDASRALGVALLCGIFSAPLAAQVAALPSASSPPAAPAAGSATSAAAPPSAAAEAAHSEAQREAELISQVRQLTLEGRRAGEGYFSADGQRMVFQSERDAANPFFQIYLLDFATGDLERISTGEGKTTCAWIHPGGERVLFASTHADPAAVAKQQAELAERQAGKQRRYSWDYDESYDLYARDLATKTLTQLTHEVGYDAEASYSPDGEWIVFSSNRHAYAQAAGNANPGPTPGAAAGAKPHPSVSPANQERLKLDASYFLDLYLMRADGSEVRRLTDVPGYDGGPFFSPDGQRICFRRFSENGATAEIYTMAVDGSDVQQLTRLGNMSWAPFYHPSGEYLIFATNKHGFENFELYLVDAAGRGEPQRVTYTPGFDGLPVFLPSGKELAWTSNRTSGGNSQIFRAAWNHAAARKLLGLDRVEVTDTAGQGTATGTAPAVGASATGTSAAAELEAAQLARQARELTAADYRAADMMRHVDFLCRPDLGGRLTGTPGELQATAYVAAYLDQLGCQPAGDNGTWFQAFEFTSGVSLGARNRLLVNEQELALEEQWLPLVFSQTGAAAAAEVVFAGYGMVAPAEENQPEYDSYVHLDVQDKWVVVLRFLPENVSAERRQYLTRYSSLRYKAMLARDRGARGLIVVTGPNSPTQSELVPLQLDGTLSGSSLPAIGVRREVVDRWLAESQTSLKQLQDALDQGEPVMGRPLTNVSISAEIDIQQVKQRGRNVIGRLLAGAAPHDGAILVGAHIDHLGTGANSSSLALDNERDLPHLGADDNASGVAAMLEVAQHLAEQQRSGRLKLQRDVIFAAWSGEELGLLGSNHYVKQLAEEGGAAERSLQTQIMACLNMDMVGRFDQKLVLQGVGSSSRWPAIIEQRNAVVGLPVVLQNDSYLPTDASSFYLRGIPILSAFTGSHQDYHTPRDTPEKLNYEKAAEIAQLMGLIARGLVLETEPLDFQQQQAPQEQGRRANLRAYLGTIPDYATEGVKGVPLSGVSAEGPAAKAGVQAGDIIVELAGKKIDNIYDYTFAIEALKVGEEVKIVVLRKDDRIEMPVTPKARD